MVLANLMDHAKEALQLDVISADPNEHVFNARNGEVFIRSSILKSDFFYGHANNKIPQYFVGAHNFRYVCIYISVSLFFSFSLFLSYYPFAFLDNPLINLLITLYI